MPKISIIVPIYNVEKYINRCVDSILNQTFTDFELILVDDGSPDNCGAICDEYAKKDKRIKVIHKENGGLSDARNAGIDVAQSEFLGFVDSDDWIHPRMYEILHKGIIENKVKLCVCEYEETELQKEYEHISYLNYTVQNGLDLLVSKNATAVVAWNKLYHRSLFEEIRYPYGKIHEDEFVTYKLLYELGNIAYCKYKLYFYFINEDSITKSEYSLKHLDAIEALEERYKFFKKKKLNKACIEYTTKELLEFYMYNYRKTKMKEFDKEYKTANRKMKNKLRYALLTKRKDGKITIKEYANYYETAFPQFMKVYWLIDIFKIKTKKYGLFFSFKKILYRLIRKNK